MQTMEECFQEYMKSYDCEGFDARAITEMRFCFFAGAIAMRMLSNQNIQQAMDDGDLKAGEKRARMLYSEIMDFVRSHDGRLRVN